MKICHVILFSKLMHTHTYFKYLAQVNLVKLKHQPTQYFVSFPSSYMRFLSVMKWKLISCGHSPFLYAFFSESVTSYARHLENKHDMLLGMLFERGTYKKLYSYRHLINGFAVHLSPEQVKSCIIYVTFLAITFYSITCNNFWV